MEVEDKWLKNTIFHHAIILIINKLNLKKVEDGRSKCVFCRKVSFHHRIAQYGNLLNLLFQSFLNRI